MRNISLLGNHRHIFSMCSAYIQPQLGHTIHRGVSAFVCSNKATKQAEAQKNGLASSKMAS